MSLSGRLRDNRLPLAALAGLMALLVLAALALGAPAIAQGPPQNPHLFWGTVTTSGQQVSAGTPIEARVGGVAKASTVVDADGRYGYDPLFNVPQDPYDTISPGATIEFYVAGIYVTSATFEVGGATPLNLDAPGLPTGPTSTPTRTQTPTRTPTPTGTWYTATPTTGSCRRTFTGFVYGGPVGSTSTPIGGARIRIYGSFSLTTQGTLLADGVSSATTGAYTVFTDASGYTYYHLVNYNPDYEHLGASSESGGIVRAADWIAFWSPTCNVTLAGNNFWDQPLSQTPTPTPTRTPTATASPTLTPTPTSSPGPVHPSDQWVTFYGQVQMSDGGLAPAGGTLDAYTPDGLRAGTTTLASPGIYSQLRVYRDDPGTPAKDGALPGERIRFFYNGVPAVPIGPGNTIWTAHNDIHNVNLVVGQPVHRVLYLPVGWNLISPGVMPLNPDVEDALATIAGTYNKVLGFSCTAGGQSYYPPPFPPQLNTLRTIDARGGYWIYMTQEAHLVILGVPIPANTPIDICSGYNLVGYLPAAPQPVGTALTTLAGKIIVVLGFDPVAGGQSYYPTLPPGINTLQELVPGRGYWIRASQSGQLIYP